MYEGGTVFLQKPLYIFYYPDATTASRKWDELAPILAREGPFGTADFIRSGDPSEQGLLSNLNFEERVDRLFQ